ncbi:MAG TPA: hypothetical protein VF223_12030 [Trebonia sp.]
MLSKSTRVLIIVQNLPVPFDQRVWLECQALVAARYRVAVVCPEGRGKGKGDPSHAVVDLMDDAGAREQLAKVGRSRVEDELAWQHQERAYLGEYEKLTGGAGAGTRS